MGLDMYLEVAQRIEGVTVYEINRLLELKDFVLNYNSALKTKKKLESDDNYIFSSSTTIEMFHLKQDIERLKRELDGDQANIKCKNELDEKQSLYKKLYREAQEKDKRELYEYLSNNEEAYKIAKKEFDDKQSIIDAFKTSELVYWRKANEIQNWFTNRGIGNKNCDYYEVTKNDIVELLDVIDKVLADHTKADSLLPTQSGFFFGSTNYDKWYFQSLERTKEELSNVLKEYNEKEEMLVYYAWW